MVEQQKTQLKYQTVRKFGGLAVGVDYEKRVLVNNNQEKLKFFAWCFSKYTFWS